MFVENTNDVKSSMSNTNCQDNDNVSSSSFTVPFLLSDSSSVLENGIKKKSSESESENILFQVNTTFNTTSISTMSKEVLNEEIATLDEVRSYLVNIFENCAYHHAIDFIIIFPLLILYYLFFDLFFDIIHSPLSTNTNTNTNTNIIVCAYALRIFHQRILKKIVWCNVMNVSVGFTLYVRGSIRVSTRRWHEEHILCGWVYLLDFILLCFILFYFILFYFILFYFIYSN